MKKIFKWLFMLIKYRRSFDPRKVSLDNRIGKHVRIGSGIKMIGCLIRDYVWINEDCRLFFVDFGRFVSIGPRVIIGENEHVLNWLVTSEYLYSDNVLKTIRESNKKNTYISDDVWIGAGAIIKKGVSIGVGAVVGAGAVVTKDVPPYSIVAGVPAKVIRYRFNEDIVKLLQSINWLDMPYEKIRKVISMLDTTEVIDDETIKIFIDKLIEKN